MRRLLIAAAVLAASPAAAQTEFTFSTWAPPNHPINSSIFVPWAESFAAATQGRVKVRFLAKPIAHPNQHYDAIVKGQVDMAFGTYGYQPERFLPYLIAELPFLGETAVATSLALWRTHVAHIDKIGIHKDIKLLGVMTHGPGMIHHAKKPILVPEDMKGQKIRTGGDVPALIVKELGGIVITQPAPKSYEILSQGIADGIMFPAESVVGFNLTKLVTHTTYVKGGLYNSAFWVAMNKEKWEKLAKADQEAIAKLSGEAFARLGGAGWDKSDAAGIAKMKENKNALQEVKPEFVAALRRLTDKIEADYAAKMDKMGLKGAEVIKAFRAEVAKAQAGN
jgi:TRAP-type C4-dicarboxylate transport system substrate-binding protein